MKDTKMKKKILQLCDSYVSDITQRSCSYKNSENTDAAVFFVLFSQMETHC